MRLGYDEYLRTILCACFRSNRPCTDCAKKRVGVKPERQRGPVGPYVSWV